MPIYNEVRKKYAEYLQLAYTHAKEVNTGLKLNVDFRHIDNEALETWERTWKPFIKPDLPGGWDWIGLWQKYKRKTAKYFDLAIWSNNILCGLAIGKPSRSNSHCTLYNIESSPGEHSLEGYILPLIIDVAEAYTEIIGGNAVRFADPDMGLKDYYEEFGFEFVMHRKAKVRCRRNETDCIYDGETYFERYLDI